MAPLQLRLEPTEVPLSSRAGFIAGTAATSPSISSLADIEARVAYARGALRANASMSFPPPALLFLEF
eukprot:scaffold19256_cov128-Isochrysis_galbana.AAC.2